MAGTALFIGMASITAQAASVINFSTGDQNVMAHAIGNINSAVFTYGGFRSGSYDNTRAVARMDVKRAWYDKAYEAGRKLKRGSFNTQRNASKKDEEGIIITVKTYDSNGTSITHSASKVMRCR